MRSVRFIPVVGLVLGAVVLAATPSADAGTTPTPATPVATAAPAAGPTPAPPAPTNAGKIFKWGNAQWDDDFVGPLKSMWRVNRPTMVRNQHGMLTINATEASGSVVATAIGHNRRYGRWEARVRGRQYGATGTPFTAVWELVPMYGGYHCAARNIVLSQYALTATRPRCTCATCRRPTSRQQGPAPVRRHLAHLRDRGHPRPRLLVRRHPRGADRRRPAALSAAVFAARFRLVADPTAQMRQGRMQMDWVRYYTLARKNAQSIEAPQLTQGRYAAAC